MIRLRLEIKAVSGDSLLLGGHRTKIVTQKRRHLRPSQMIISNRINFIKPTSKATNNLNTNQNITITQMTIEKILKTHTLMVIKTITKILIRLQTAKTIQTRIILQTSIIIPQVIKINHIKENQMQVRIIMHLKFQKLVKQ